jgi:hypothetical protein
MAVAADGAKLADPILWARLARSQLRRACKRGAGRYAGEDPRRGLLGDVIADDRDA